MQNASMKRSFLKQNNAHFNNTFESEKSIDQAEKFTIKKELYRGIKDNDVEKIVGKADDQDHTAQSGGFYDQHADIHNQLTEMRKKHDQIKTQTNQKKKQIQLMKKQLQQLRQKQTFYNQMVTNCRKSLQDNTQVFKTINHETEVSIYTRDVYQNIIDHINKDNLVIKKRIFDKEMELGKLKTKFKTTYNDATSKKKLTQQCQKMLHSMNRVVEFQKQNRESKINSIYEVLNKKQQNYFKKANREKEIEEVVVNAMNEKSPEEKEWIKILLTNKALSAILRKKIERQLQNNSVIENAFQNIKINTGINQCDEFVEKFLTREQTYGELLNSISQKQPKLEKQQTQNQRLKQIERTLIQKLQTQSNVNKAPVGNTDYHKRLENLQKKRLSFQRQKQALYQWLIKFLKRYDSIVDSNNRKHVNYFQIYPRSEITKLYKKVSETIFTILKEAEPKPEVIDLLLLKNTPKEARMDEKFYERNTRVKTLTSEYSPDQKDDEQENTEQASQLDYLGQYRKNVKKDMKNKKFRIKTKAY